MALTTDENDNLVPERAAEIAELKRQGEMEALMMGLETVTVTLSNINAKLRHVDACIEADLSKPILTEAELKVQQEMFKSIAERVLKLGQIAAKIEGTELPPSDGNVGDIIGAVMKEAQDYYGVDAGTQPNSNAPTLENPEDVAMLAEIKEHFDKSEGQTPLRRSIQQSSHIADPTKALTYSESTRDDDYDPNAPLVPSDEFMAEVYSDANWSDDTTADEDTALYNGPDAVLEDGTMIEFKTSRNPCSEIELPDAGGPLPVPFDTKVFADFPKVDFRSEEECQKMMAYIIDFYVNMCAAAHQSGMISEEFALRLAQEIHMVPADEVENPEIEMPLPGTLADDIATRAGQGETFNTYLVYDHIEVGEIIIASFMTTMAFFNSRVSAAYLQDRLAAIGMSA